MATLLSLGFSVVLISSANAFQLLDVGAPRTGTQSMYAAFKMLGLKPRHSGYDLTAREPLCGYLFGNASGNRSLDDALATLSGFDAAMDEPYMLLYEEIMAAFPEAKFLLTISDAESWFNNYVDLEHRYQRAHESPTDGRPFYHQNCTGMRSWGCHFVYHAQNQTEADYASRKETCLQNYERHIERVQQVIPPEKLLVYNWSDGWAPLTHFLHLPVPEEEFPRVDEVKIHLDVRGKIMDVLGMSG